MLLTSKVTNSNHLATSTNDESNYLIHSVVLLTYGKDGRQYMVDSGIVNAKLGLECEHQNQLIGRIKK